MRILARQPAARIAVAALSVTILAVIVIVMWPQPPAADDQRALAAWLAAAHSAGLPAWITFDLVEFTANIVMFTPLGFFATIALPRRRWVVPLAGVALSAVIETAQFLLLPARFGSLGDVVANGIGALAGYLAASAGLALRRRRLEQTRVEAFSLPAVGRFERV